MEKEKFFDLQENGMVRCCLCPHNCNIKDGNFGLCRVRGNKGGKAVLPYYGSITAMALDPIEKKPLYHFKPGSMILSIGFLGCNLRCPFCQNWHISQDLSTAERSVMQLQPSDIVFSSLQKDSHAIAYTYSEPLVHAEFLLDCMSLARKNGLANVLVTNGFINRDAAQEILSLADAVNIDLKCFSEQTYAQTLGGAGKSKALKTVLDFIRLSHSKAIHTEITTLIVPGLNDNDSELESCAEFIGSLDLPWHLSAYHPDYKYHAPPTDPGYLERIKVRYSKKLKYIYTGNILGEKNNTLCSHCSAILVRRSGYKTDITGLIPPAKEEKFYRCRNCNGETNIIY